MNKEVNILSFKDAVRNWKKRTPLSLTLSALLALSGCGPSSSANGADRAQTLTPTELIGPVLVTPTALPGESTLVYEGKIIPPGFIGTFAYGAIVNDTNDVTFEIFPDVLNRLSRDPDIGIIAPEGFLYAFHLMDGFIRTDGESIRDRYDLEQGQHNIFRLAGVEFQLLTLLQEVFRGRRSISFPDIMVESSIIESQLKVNWANVFFILRYDLLLPPSFNVLSPKALQRLEDYRPLRIVHVGNSFLQKLNE